MKRRENLDKLGTILGWLGVDAAEVGDADKDGEFIDLQSRKAQLARLTRRRQGDEDEESNDGE